MTMTMITWFWLPTATRIRMLPRSPSTNVAEYTTSGSATWSLSIWWSWRWWCKDPDDHDVKIMMRIMIKLRRCKETWIRGWHHDDTKRKIFFSVNIWSFLYPLSNPPTHGSVYPGKNLFISSDRSSYSDSVLLQYNIRTATFWDFEHFCQYI